MSAPASTLPYSASIEEVIRLTGLSKTKLYALLAEGKLQGKKHGRRTLVMMDGVRSYVDALPKAEFGAVVKAPSGDKDGVLPKSIKNEGDAFFNFSRRAP